MSGKPLSVSVNPRGTGFVKLGDNHRYKVVPESIHYGSDINEYGSLGATMLLQMNPLFPHYDLEQYTPIVINDGAVDLWSGRIIGTPTEYGNTGIVHVECQGWGQHTKDDCTNQESSISDLNRWVDMRQVNSFVNLNTWNLPSMETSNESGALKISIANGTPWISGFNVGLCLYVGEDQYASGISFDYEGSGNFNAALIVHQYTSNFAALVSTTVNTGWNSGSSNINLGSLQKNTRYVVLASQYGANGNCGADAYIRFKNVVVALNGYNTGVGYADVDATKCIKTVLNQCCPLISSDQSRIVQTSLKFPNFPGQSGFGYANDFINKANAPHGYKFYLTPQPVPVPVFEPQDSDYTFVLGVQDEYGFKDPSRNDGRTVYNRIISEFQGADNVQSYSSYETAYTEIPQNIPNPSFDVNTATWQMSSGSIARYTSSFDTSPASGQLIGDASGNAVSAILASPMQLQPLTRYRCIMRMKKDSSADGRGNIYIQDVNGSPLNYNIKYNYDDVFGAMDFVNWYSIVVDFISPADGKVYGPGFAVKGTSFNPIFYVDSVKFYARTANVIDRRGFRRTALRPMDTKSTSAIASSIALLEYNNSQFPPLKGAVEVKGFIRTKNGQRIPVNRIPSMVGKAILFEQLRDPNTGAFGRQAVIRSAEYDEITDTVAIACDDDFNFIQNLRARLLT